MRRLPNKRTLGAEPRLGGVGAWGTVPGATTRRVGQLDWWRRWWVAMPPGMRRRTVLRSDDSTKRKQQQQHDSERKEIKRKAKRHPCCSAPRTHNTRQATGGRFLCGMLSSNCFAQLLVQVNSRVQE